MNEEISDVLEDNDDAKLLKAIKSKYEIVKEHSDIKQTEVHKELMEIDQTFRPKKIKNVLESAGVKVNIVRGIRYYRGLQKL